jgi:hypothetical protein
LLSPSKGYGGKTRYTDSLNSDTTAPGVTELYHFQFSLQEASLETFGYALSLSHSHTHTITLPEVLYGCETLSLSLREENRVLRRILGPKRKRQEAGEDFIMRSFITCTLHQILLG